MSKQLIVSLRQLTGAGIVDVQKALSEAGGNEGRAIEILRQRGKAKALKKMDRETREGLVHAYVHANGRIGSLVEVACETDFVARNEDFRRFAHDIAMQVAAAHPLYLRSEDVPEDAKEKELQIYRHEFEAEGKPKGKSEEMIAKILDGKMAKFYQETCLLEQFSIKDDNKTIRELVAEISAKVGEKVEIKRFVHFALGA